jgi:hypothetical protein
VGTCSWYIHQLSCVSASSIRIKDNNNRSLFSFGILIVFNICNYIYIIYIYINHQLLAYLYVTMLIKEAMMTAVLTGARCRMLGFKLHSWWIPTHNFILFFSKKNIMNSDCIACWQVYLIRLLLFYFIFNSSFVSWSWRTI